MYQDLSESARERYALLQTPEFVEEFILDRTLNPAIEEFGLEKVRLIDPTCGSGHFLLYCFDLLVGIYEEAWADPRLSARGLASQAPEGGPGWSARIPTVSLVRNASEPLAPAPALGADTDAVARELQSLP